MSTKQIHYPADQSVAYLGPGGSHSHLAAIRIFGALHESGFRFIPVDDLSRVIESVLEGRAGWAVLPYYNTTSGEVKSVYPALLDVDHSWLKHCCVFACVSLPIVHDLLGCGALEDVSIVYSKQEAYEQCRATIAGVLPHVQFEPCRSTAEAARLAENTSNTAAIASSSILPFHRNLSILARAVQDDCRNYTRFLVIRHNRESDIQMPTSSGLHPETWLWFDSSIQDGVLTGIMKRASEWGLSSDVFQGAVTDPDSLARRFLMTIPKGPDSFKVRFFQSTIGHLAVKRCMHPYVLGPKMVADLKHHIAHNFSHKDDLFVDDFDIATSLLSMEIITRLRSIPDTRLFVHGDVKSCENVWEILGAPASHIVNTQVCTIQDDPRVVFCAVPGDQKVNIDAVSNAIGKTCRRAAIPQLTHLRQRLGAISPLTAPDNAVILVDESFEGCERVLMGSGHPQVSVVTSSAQLFLLSRDGVGRFSLYD